MTRPKKLFITSIGAVALCVAALMHYVKSHPLIFNESFFSHAHCIQIAGLDMDLYAQDHNGKYPFHTNGYGNALLMMTNESKGNWFAQTGPCYSTRPFEEALRQGKHLPEEECGRVYVQGFGEKDNPDIVILFDKQPTPGGDHCHGFARFRMPLVREYVKVGGVAGVVEEREWPAFSKRQIELLVAAGIRRTEAERLYSQKGMIR